MPAFSRFAVKCYCTSVLSAIGESHAIVELEGSHSSFLTPDATRWDKRNDCVRVPIESRDGLQTRGHVTGAKGVFSGQTLFQPVGKHVASASPTGFGN